LTLNNETAEIKIVTDEAIGVKSTESSSGGAVGTTTQEAERGETGVLLRVTPQINGDSNEITMFIIPAAASAATGLVWGSNTYKDVEVRYTKSIVRVKDGETVVLGGLIRRQYSNTDTKLPFFGDLPLIGRLFTNKTKDTDKDRELLVFITPHIVRNTPIQLAQAKKGVLPEREQNTVSRVDRQGVIDASLQNFERKKKK
jgi:type II secretory pathway component GspD/PulD (secretin)